VDAYFLFESISQVVQQHFPTLRRSSINLLVSDRDILYDYVYRLRVFQSTFFQFVRTRKETLT